jgi:photosystem II stability/assembly factor-like uncharacterized protein
VPRTGFLPRAVLGAALVAVALAFAAPAAQADQVASQWTWSDYGPALRDVSCSLPGECAAVGQRGMVLHSTGDSDDPLAWSRIPLEYPEELAGITCTRSFCLAVSNRRTVPATYTSKVFRSSDGGETWSDGVALPAAGAAKTRSALDVACAEDCYAVGPGGGVWRSRDQGRSWDALDLPAKPASYSEVACPADGVCVAAGGDAVGSTALVEGAKVAPVPLPALTGKGIRALACDSVKRCTVADGLGNFISLSIPDKAWGAVKPFPKSTVVSSLSCPVEEVCVGLAGPIALRTTALSSATGEWARRPLGTLNLGAIDCPQTACVAVGKAGSWFASFDDGSNWSRINEVGKFDTIQCSDDWGETCVAGGEKDIGVSRSEGRLWSLPLSGETGLNVKSVNCTDRSECLFLGKTLTLFTTDLRQFAERRPTLSDPRGTDALTCISKEVCVGINEGVVYTTLDGAVTGWDQTSFPDKATSVACLHGRTDPAVCVATTRDFLLLGTMVQKGDEVRWSWRTTDADPSEGLEAVACSPGGQCTAVGGGGVILASDGTDLMHWTETIVPSELTPVDTRPKLRSVACPANGVCLVGGEKTPDAAILSTTNNWADFSYEKIQGIEGAAPMIKSFGCESVNRCVAVGSTSLVGVRKPSDRQPDGSGDDAPDPDDSRNAR